MGASSGAIAAVVVAVLAAALLAASIAVYVRTRAPRTYTIPVRFDTDTGLLQLPVILGGTQTRAVINTADGTSVFGATGCANCTPPLYDPEASGTETQLGVAQSVDFTTATFTGTLFTDTLDVYQTTDTGCGPAGAAAAATPGPLLGVPRFLFVAATSVTQPNHPNQIGMAPTLLADSPSESAADIRKAFPGRVYESSVLEHLWRTQDAVRWGLSLRDPVSALWLGRPPSKQCPARAFTPLVRALPDATVPSLRAAGAFYVVRVTRALIDTARGTTQLRPADTPRYCVLSTGTPFVECPPGGLADALVAPGATTGVGLTLVFENDVVLTVPRARTPWYQRGAAKPRSAYHAMTDDIATALSSKKDVMVLGNLGMLDHVFEFRIDHKEVGVAAVGT